MTRAAPSAIPRGRHRRKVPSCRVSPARPQKNNPGTIRRDRVRRAADLEDLSEGHAETDQATDLGFVPGTRLGVGQADQERDHRGGDSGALADALAAWLGLPYAFFLALPALAQPYPRKVIRLAYPSAESKLDPAATWKWIA